MPPGSSRYALQGITPNHELYFPQSLLAPQSARFPYIFNKIPDFHKKTNKLMVLPHAEPFFEKVMLAGYSPAVRISP